MKARRRPPVGRGSAGETDSDLRAEQHAKNPSDADPDAPEPVEKEIQKDLEAKLGSPGKWELLFTKKGKLVDALARRINLGPSHWNPTLSPEHNPSVSSESKAACVPYDATIPAVHDWQVVQAFEDAGCRSRLPRFYVAGARERYALDPAKVKVGILIAGGPAAGLNMVTDSIVKRHFALATQLALQSGGKQDAKRRKRAKHYLVIFGYRGGYWGLEARDRVLLMPSPRAREQATHRAVREAMRADTTTSAPKLPPLELWYSDPWAGEAGVRLGAGRAKDRGHESGPEDYARWVVEDELDILYVIGGDGTLKCAAQIEETLAKWRREGALDRDVVIVGGPKTMDNDINFTDATFGFQTAVDNAVEHIRTIKASAAATGRLGVIELFGAGSGFVALYAGYASGVADVVMIPELIPEPQSRHSALKYIEQVIDQLKKRVKDRGHAVLVVAEGAIAPLEKTEAAVGPSGQSRSPSTFQQGKQAEKRKAFDELLERLEESVGCKVCDVRARYLIRDTQPNASDLILCKWTGKLMVDTALAGFTGCSVHLWQGDFVLVPFSSATCKLKQVTTWGYLLQTLLDRERIALRR
jgi:6-phosphofructokinase 1